MAPPAPRALRKERWEQIQPDLREEALERAAWLTYRGREPSAALEAALVGMSDDLASLEVEPAWTVVRAVAAAWPGPRRTATGNYHTRILNLAEAVERAAQAELVEPGCVDPGTQFSALIVSAEHQAAVVSAFEARLYELTGPTAFVEEPPTADYAYLEAADDEFAVESFDSSTIS